jgi:hypothetical protein
VVAVACGLVAYLAWGRKQDGGTATGELAVQLTENPLPPYESGLERSPHGSLSHRARTTAQRSSNVYIYMQVLYQPARILVGYIQVNQCYEKHVCICTVSDVGL